MAWAHWAAAVLYNGLARYDQAASAARRATSDILDPWMSIWALPELVEAAARIGDAGLARDALEQLADTTQPAGTDVVVGIESRCRAGPERNGWPFGRPVQAFEVSAVLASAPGIASVDEVMLFPADLATGQRGEPTPRLDIGEDALIASYRHQVRVT